MKRRFFVLALVAAGGIAASPTTAWSQSSTVGPFVLGAPASAQAAALGGAFPLGSGTADVLFYQPAALDGAGGVAAYRASYGEGGSMSTVAAATSWFGGTVGVGLQSLAYRGSGGLGGAAAYEAGLRSDPGAPVQTLAENVLSVGYARAAGPVQVGVVGKWVGMRAGSEQVGGAAVDVGTSIDAGPAVVALSVRNLGGELSSGTNTLDQPRIVSLMAASDVMQVGALDLSAAARLSRDGQGDVSPGAGLEVSYWPVRFRTFAVRVGYGHPTADDPAEGFTAGGSFRGDQIGLHYAFGRLDDSQSVHRFSITWR